MCGGGKAITAKYTTSFNEWNQEAHLWVFCLKSDRGGKSQKMSPVLTYLERALFNLNAFFFNVFNAFLKVFWMTEKVMALFRLLLFFFIDVTKL